MPIYEYECEKCGEFEQMQRITDPPLARCPTCKRKVRRLISSTSFQLKGTGWYVTDYAKSGSGNGGKKKGGGDSSSSDSSSSSSSDTKSEGKSESKSESKSETKTASSGGGDGKSGS
jgi:putative FmdB family regulatory protein